MRIGFTGTRNGMSVKQFARVTWLVNRLWSKGAEFHHGMCIGADVEAHRIARAAGFRVVGWPGTDRDGRSPLLGIIHAEVDLQHEPLPYLTRNRAIVDACDTVIAAPAGFLEQQRGGTWSTIRYARKHNKHIIVYPDGSDSSEVESV